MSTLFSKDQLLLVVAGYEGVSHNLNLSLYSRFNLLGCIRGVYSCIAMHTHGGDRKRVSGQRRPRLDTIYYIRLHQRKTVYTCVISCVHYLCEFGLSGQMYRGGS